MRKFLAVFILVAVLLLCGCAAQDAPSSTAETDAPVSTTSASAYFPQGSYLGALNFSDMTFEQAYEILKNAIESYILTVATEAGAVNISGAQLRLQADEALLRQWLETGIVPDDLLTCDLTAVNDALEDAFGAAAQNATVCYSSNAGRFISVEEKAGTGVDTAQALTDAQNAIEQLCPTVQTAVTLFSVQPQITVSDPLVSRAVQQADRYLRPELKYIYNIPDSRSYTVSIKKSELAGFVSIDRDLNVGLDEQAIKSYIAKMAGKYGGAVTKGEMRAFDGTQVGLTVEYFGCQLDQQAMYDDLVYCLENGVSGSRMNSYITAETPLPYGGNYVEIDLKNQKLYVLQAGTVVVATDIVSGDISSGNKTPSGVFSIYTKETDRWLTGPTWRDFVSYWIGYDGNYGIHDASWRTEFGGEIYKYDGSHGCTNLPVAISGDVYHNVSLDTRVIVHSSSGAVENLQQQITGTNAYTLTDRDAPFILDAAIAYPGVAVSFTSSDPSVVTVNEFGVVTPVGAGKAQITVCAEQTGPLSGAEFVIDITVNKWVSSKPAGSFLDFFTSL